MTLRIWNVYKFILFNKYLRIIQYLLDYVPRILLGTDDTAFNKTRQSPVFEVLMF